MALATRGESDREALHDYVATYAEVLAAWRAFPALTVRLDRACAERAALECRQEQEAART